MVQSPDIQAISNIAAILIDKNSKAKSTIQYASLQISRENRVASFLKDLTFFPEVFAKTEQDESVFYPDQCTLFYPTLWDALTPNVNGLNKNLNRTSSDIVSSINDLGESVREEVVFIAYDIDIDSDGIADLNIATPDTEELEYINLDTNCDGTADINIDSDGNGVADTNIDEDGDGIGDYSIVAAGGVSVANAIVKLIHKNTGDTFESTTNLNGEFSIAELRTGQYKIDIRYVSPTSGKTLWTLQAPYIDSSGNIGTFRLDTRPHIIKGTVIQDNESIEYDLYGKKRTEVYANLPITQGSVVRLHLSLIDPNNDIVRMSETSFGETGWAYELISQSSVSDHGTDEQEIILDIQFNEGSYEYVGINKFRLPWNIAENMTAVECVFFLKKDELTSVEPEIDEEIEIIECPDKVNWSEVRKIHHAFKLNNSDGLGSLDGSDDIILHFSIGNLNWDYSPPAVNNEIPIINSITINDHIYTNFELSENQVIDLGDISTLGQLDITIESTADEDYPLHNLIGFYTESSYSESIDGFATQTSAQIDVTDLLKTYYEGTISITSMYREPSSEGWIYHSNDAATVAINYSVAGNASPAQCEGISIDGSDGDNSKRIFFVGQEVTLSPIFSDPNDLPVEYRITKSGNASWSPGDDTYITGFNPDQNEDNPFENAGWIPTADDITYVFKEDDNIEELTFAISCRNNDGIGRDSSNSADTHHSEKIYVMGI